MSFHRAQLRLYLVTDRDLCAALGVVETVTRAVAGGVTMVQLRDKTATTAQRIELAIALKQALHGTDVPLVINDDIDAAVAAGVCGAHIGQGDIAPAQARARLGPDKILGLSCETVQTVQAADASVVDYLGLGPVFGTPTKTDHAQPIEMIFLQPIERIGNQEIRNLVPAEIVDQRVPVMVEPFARIGMFVKMRAVKHGEAVRVGREMRGNPVGQHAQTLLVRSINQIAEFVRRAEADGRSIHADGLITP